MAPTRREVLQGALGAAWGFSAFAASGSKATTRHPQKYDEPVDVYAPAPPRGTPIQLTASGTFAAGATGGVNAVALVNPNPGPMEIDAIKFGMKYTTPTGVTLVNAPATALGAVMQAELMLGKMPLTNGPVPTWLFGRALNLIREQISANATGIFYAEFRWKLTRPLWVPAGATVLPKFQNTGVLGGSIVQTVTYEARSLPQGSPQPPTIYVPFVSAWLSKQFNLDGTSQKDNSRETDLMNPFDVPLYIQRFTGRLPTIFISSGNPNVDESYYPDGDDNMVTVRIMSSRGQPVVRDPIAFRLVFDREGRSWECPHILKPHEFYTIYLVAKDSITNAQSFQAQVGMVGHREVSGDLSAVFP